jgi:phospholipase/carboxylesterase
MPAELNDPRKIIDDSIGLVLDALGTILRASSADLQETIVQVWRSFRRIYRVQENLYPIRFTSPHLDRFFLESHIDDRDERLDPRPQKEILVGLNHFGIEDDYYARGAVSLYVPEYYDAAIEWPLVIALHGGFGHGRDFIWTWLREARSRGFIVLSPTSKATTWSILNPEIDGKAIISMIEFFKKHYNFSMDRMLLTGISDGATFALICSLQQNSPFNSIAPVAGVLPPLDIYSTQGKRIYWVHGALDWMFPVRLAEGASEALKMSGADITLRVIDDLSHTYPREENDRILKWFEPGLALPEQNSM